MFAAAGAHHRRQIEHGWLYRKTEPFFVGLNRGFAWVLRGALRGRWIVLVLTLAFAVTGPYLYTKLQRELTPLEDRGVFTASFIGPVGSTPEYNAIYSRQMEQMLLAMPELDRTYHRTGDGRAFIYATLKPWEQRTRKTQEGSTPQVPARRFGGQVSRRCGPQPGRSSGRVQLVLQAAFRPAVQQMLAVMREQLFQVPRTTRRPPQLDVRIDRAKAADPVPVSDVARPWNVARQCCNIPAGNRQYELVQVDATRTSPSDLSRSM